MTVNQLKAEMEQLILEGHGRLDIVCLSQPIPSVLYTNRDNLPDTLKGKTSIWDGFNGKKILLT